MGALKDFLKRMSDERELGCNIASLLLDFLDGTVSEDELENRWGKLCVPIANFLQEEDAALNIAVYLLKET